VHAQFARSVRLDRPVVVRVRIRLLDGERSRITLDLVYLVPESVKQ